MGFCMNYNKEAKRLTFRRGSEVSQVITMFIGITIVYDPYYQPPSCISFGHAVASFTIILFFVAIVLAGGLRFQSGSGCSPSA